MSLGPSYYLDSSAFVKLYVDEENSHRLAAWIAKKKSRLYITDLHELEFKNALALRVFRKHLSSKDYSDLLIFYLEGLKYGTIIKTTISWPRIFGRSFDLSQQFTPEIGARSLDILHLAIAETLQIKEFVTFDEKQKELAKKLSFKIPEI